MDDSLVEDIFGQACGVDRVYTTYQWAPFPDVATITNESTLYCPFVDVANYITQQCRILRPKNDNEVRWMTDSRRHPLSGNNGHMNMADMKLDIVATIGMLEVPEPQTGSQEGRPAWCRILVPLEVKKRAPELALLQLVKYQRQVLRESLDRRFVLGIV